MRRAPKWRNRPAPRRCKHGQSCHRAAPWSFYLALFILSTGAAAAIVALAPPGNETVNTGASRNGHTTRLHTIIITGAALVASAALLDLSPWLLLAAGGAAALTHPSVVLLVFSNSRPRPVPTRAHRRPPHPTPVGPASSLRSVGPCASDQLGTQVDAVFLDCLGTLELCHTWRRSFVWLQAARTDEHRLRIVASRERCLSELLRRDPDGIMEWLEHSPRAASGPEKKPNQQSGTALGAPTTSPCDRGLREAPLLNASARPQTASTPLSVRQPPDLNP